MRIRGDKKGIIRGVWWQGSRERREKKKKKRGKGRDRELKSTASGRQGRRARRRDDTPARDNQREREGWREEEGDTRGGEGRGGRRVVERASGRGGGGERGQAEGRWDEMLVVLTV